MDETRKLAGRCIIQGFEGESLPTRLVKDLEQGALGGVVLFKRNVRTPAQVHALLTELKDRAPEGERPIGAVDQEGGRVARIREPLTVLPPALTFGQFNDPVVTTMAGRLVGRELRALGFTLNFAPVLDVNTNPDSPVIGDRSFGSTVKEVVRHGLAFGRGLKEGGVYPCAKHFPGHGDAKVDSHVGLPIVEHGVKRLEEVEMEPFLAWARTALGPVMTAHVLYPALDLELPATMSRKIVEGILREKFHFKGVIFSDDLEMGAIANHGGAVEAAVNIIRAGVDGLLVCRDMDLRHEIMDRLCDEAARNMDIHAKLKKAVARLAPLAYPVGPNVSFSFIGSDEHRNLSANLVGKMKESAISGSSRQS